MAGLVAELQSDALDRKTSVTDLLRKALVVSKKLSITQIEVWLSHELNGYPKDVEVDIPKYRHVRGQIKVHNPYHGWQPVHFGDPAMGEILSTRTISQPIGELEALNLNASSTLTIPYPENIKNQLMAGMDVALPPILHVSSTSVVGILDAVRNNILEWALQLEQQGISGQGMSFSKQEQQAASQINYNITNNIGSMQNSQIQQASPSGSQKLSIENEINEISKIISSLKDSVDQLNLPIAAKDELNSEIDTILSQSRSPKPKSGILRESLKTIRTILEGAAGNVIASGILIQLARYV